MKLYNLKSGDKFRFNIPEIDKDKAFQFIKVDGVYAQFYHLDENGNRVGGFDLIACWAEVEKL